MKIAVVIPCYKVENHILDVIGQIGESVSNIYVVDDACPNGSGLLVRQHCRDARVCVLFNEKNLGVGGAVIRGYQMATSDHCKIIVKLDGDGQMNPSLIPFFTAPIERREVDYTKGNRFFYLDQIKKMPTLRIFGNAILSIITKFSSGYWDIFDPTNGFTAIHSNVLRKLPLEKVSKGYFFESDMLFRLNTIQAVVADIPMEAVYGNEVSNLTVNVIISEFFTKNIKNFFKRIFYNYYLKNMSMASLKLLIGLICFVFGAIFGSVHWYQSVKTGVVASTGTVFIAALPVIIGVGLLIAFIHDDVQSVPKRSVHHDW